MPAKKKWMVNPSRGESVTIEAERVELNESQSRVTFYNGDEAVASFVGSNGFYPVS